MTVRDAIDQPLPPAGPANPQTSGGTAVLEQTSVQRQKAPGDNERFAHYVRGESAAAAAVTGQPAVALCGKVWTPIKDPSQFPICPRCKAIYDEINNQPPGWPFFGSGSGGGQGGAENNGTGKSE